MACVLTAAPPVGVPPLRVSETWSGSSKGCRPPKKANEAGGRQVEDALMSWLKLSMVKAAGVAVLALALAAPPADAQRFRLGRGSGYSGSYGGSGYGWGGYSGNYRSSYPGSYGYGYGSP